MSVNNFLKNPNLSHSKNYLIFTQTTVKERLVMGGGGVGKSQQRLRVI
jgi:hypothetical protein